jgi:two-component system sensor histidine kinase BaeS
MLEPDPDLFASLHDEAVLQQRLVDDLQELALAESGGLTYHRMRLDLSELLETCRTAHSAVAESAAVRLEVETGDLPLIRADPDRLRQAVGNLVTNALKATPPGGSVILRGFTSMGDVVITVTDDGRGIATDQLPHVFDRFWRADGARGRTTGGRGLGLAIARHIIAAHGGTITASSTLGVGSVFTIRLPVAAPAVEAPERRG